MSDIAHNGFRLLVLTLAVFGLGMAGALVTAEPAEAATIWLGAGCGPDDDATVGVLCHVHLLNLD